jgi:hypothetical protein
MPLDFNLFNRRCKSFIIVFKRFSLLFLLLIYVAFDAISLTFTRFCVNLSFRLGYRFRFISFSRTSFARLFGRPRWFVA